MAIRDWSAVKVLGSVATKIWAAAGAVLLTLFILYCFFGGLFAFILLLFAVSGLLYHAQDSLLYHPEMPTHSRVFVPVPTMYQLPFENVHIKSTDGVTLHAFWLWHQKNNSGIHLPTIVYLHGNAGNMGHRLQNVSGIFNTLQCNVLLVEYRGYGLSTGEPSERGFYSDVRAAIDYLYTRHDLDHSQIIVFGRSLGGAVAIDVAADSVYASKLMAVIVENTFTSIPEMAAVLIHPAVKHLPLFCYRNKYLSVDKIAFASAPCLFVSGLADTLVPPQMMVALHNKCGSSYKQMLQISGGSHNDSWTAAGYYKGLSRFIGQCREARGAVLVTTPPPTMTSTASPTNVAQSVGMVDGHAIDMDSVRASTMPLLQHV